MRVRVRARVRARVRVSERERETVLRFQPEEPVQELKKRVHKSFFDAHI